MADMTVADLPGILVVLSGPAGVGKTTVASRLLQRPGFVRSVSATTRPMRPGEVSGKDYHFVTREHFGRLLDQNELIEYAEVFGNFYGTPKQPLRDAIARREVMLLVIDVNGGRQVAEKKLDALLVFLAPPSKLELTRRLERRATESAEDQAKRLARAAEEVRAASEFYDAVVVNDELDACVAKVADVIHRRRLELRGRQERGETLYQGLGK
ncbi:guanylate kinase [bacterium]|nr:MAG: guanylate kinase [bacterium]RIK60829.1 MAG: guanylate kinase [Planctomycetota bacterium]